MVGFQSRRNMIPNDSFQLSSFGWCARFLPLLPCELVNDGSWPLPESCFGPPTEPPTTLVAWKSQGRREWTGMAGCWRKMLALFFPSPLSCVFDTSLRFFLQKCRARLMSYRELGYLRFATILVPFLKRFPLWRTMRIVQLGLRPHVLK